MSFTETSTYTYSIADIEIVMRRFAADIVMIAQSTAAITEDVARQYAHDAEALAKMGYIKKVDVTLLSAGVEMRAARYDVNTSSGELTSSRPGGVLWPRFADANLRVILTYTDAYTGAAREVMRKALKISWTPSSVDLSHPTLSLAGGRDFASNGWGLQRKDYAA